MFFFSFFFFLHTFTFQLLDKPWSQVSSLLPPRFLPSIFIAHRVQQSHCSSSVHRVLLTHALALSASQFVHKKKSRRIYTSVHSAGLELTKLTYTRLEDNLMRHRGDRLDIRGVGGRYWNKNVSARPNGLREKAETASSCRGPGRARKKKKRYVHQQSGGE